MTITIPVAIAAHPDTPGRSGQVHAGVVSGLPSSSRNSTSWFAARSVTQAPGPLTDVHTPPGDRNPLATTSEVLVGLPGAGAPLASTRSPLPASEHRSPTSSAF